VSREGPTVPGKPLGWLITKAAAALGLRLSRAFSEAGLAISPEQYGVLSVVARGSDPSQADVARALGRDGPSVTRLVDGLESGGFLERRRREGDRRAYILAATESGLRVLEVADSISRKEELGLRDILSAGAIPAVETSMARILNRYGNADD
jgi:DNA-binding MarR family transcriptional regulator